jgi:hypothetical protein
MTIKQGLSLGVAAIALAALAPMSAGAQQVKVGAHDLGGVVKSEKGPEAGVWVVAETTGLPTQFSKIVVTDEQGRFVVPDLPDATYSVWVRGYGLVDSPRVRTRPGKTLDLTAVIAATDAAAAQYYPAIYWYSMLQIPDKSQFGTDAMPEKLTQQEWLTHLKNRDCVGCHQLGQLATRTIPAAFSGMTGEEAWMRRVQSGQAAPLMVEPLAGIMGGVPFHYFGDWTDRIAKGELPKEKPPRPAGIERNIVVTTWEWGSDSTYLHDEISTDKRNPTVNAYGPLYGSAEYSTDYLPILNVKTNSDTTFHAPVRDPGMPESLGAGHAAIEKPQMPSAYWGDLKIWSNHVNNHNSMLDEKGRLWLAAAFRAPDNPAFCKKGSDNVSAKLFPIEKNVRQLAMYDPKTKKYTFIDTCFGTHHVQFAFDKNDTLWASGGGPVVGWLNAKKFLETGDAAASQGWTALILDTNGNGKRDEGYTQPGQPMDPSKDMRIPGGFYAIMPSPVDGSIWGTVGVFGGPQGVVRLDPGPNPPATARAELFKVPAPGFGPRGGDIDSKGVVWVSLGSGHLGSFDRTKCKGPLNGPTATGDHCPEGWTLYQYPGPGFAGIGPNSAEASYYTWVDQHNTLGLGNDVVISTGNENDALLALKDGKWIVLRMPYPLSFYTKGLDGRIDDPKAGWKGRGLWTTSGDRTPWLKEGGKGTRPLAVHFQVRPDPLAD